MGAGASADHSPRPVTGAVKGKGAKSLPVGAGAVASTFEANPFDDSPFAADNKGFVGNSAKGGGGDPPVMSEAKLKKMALGLPGYKDVQRDYDETLMELGKFNSVKTEEWNNPVGNGDGAVKLEKLTDGYPYGKNANKAASAIESSVDPRALQRQRQQNAVASGIPSNSPAGPPKKAPAPPKRPGPAPPRPTHLPGSDPSKAAAAGGGGIGPIGDPRVIEVSAPSTFLAAPVGPLQGAPPSLHAASLVSSNINARVGTAPLSATSKVNASQSEELGMLAGADAILNRQTPQKQRRSDPAAAAAAAAAAARANVPSTPEPKSATPVPTSTRAGIAASPAAPTSFSPPPKTHKSPYPSAQKAKRDDEDDDDDDQTEEGGLYEWTAFDTSADYKRSQPGPEVKVKAPSQPPPHMATGPTTPPPRQGLPVRPFPKDDDVDDMYATFGPREDTTPVPKKPSAVPSLNISGTGSQGSSSSDVTGNGGASTAHLGQQASANSSFAMTPSGAAGSSMSKFPKGQAPPPPSSSPAAKTPGNGPGLGQPPVQGAASQRMAPTRGAPPKPTTKNPHEVKETTEVNRNKAQLPQALTHAKPTTGDWLKKRYIVNNYILLDVLGVGSYGEVRLCKDRTTDHLYAIKIFSKDMLRKKKGGSTETYFEDVKREIAVMKKLLHPNVLRLYEVLDDPNVNKMYLILEYMKKGDLINILQRNSQNAGTSAEGKIEGFTPLSDLELWNIFRQVAAGIRYLHFQNIVHGDIKPQNLLVSEDGVVKIADFGIAKMLHASGQKLVDSSGTPAFMSPELFDTGGSFSGQLADIWAIGATMFMLRFGAPPFVAKNVVTLSNKIQNDPLVFPGPIEDKLRDLLENMLIKNPSSRFTLQQVIMHPWMRVQPAPPSMQARPQSLGGAAAMSGAVSDKGRTPPVTPIKGYNFAPPSSYESAEAAASANAPISTNKEDIYMSIGYRKNKNKAASAGAGAIGEEEEEEEDDDGGAAATATGGDSNVMATKWGEDVFEMVEADDFNSDDDDDDSAAPSAGTSSASLVKTKQGVERSMMTTGERSEMTAAEEELRSNRFKKSSKQRRSHESMDGTGSINAGQVVANDSTSSMQDIGAQASARQSQQGQPDEEEDDVGDLETSTTNLTMSEFGAMMDTLALQPRSQNISAAAPLMLEVKPANFSVQLRNLNNGVGAAFHSEQGQRAEQEDRCVLLPDVGAMRALQGNEKVTSATRDILSKFSVAAVFDGHSGWQCSQFLSQHLIPALALHSKFLDNKLEPSILETFRNIDMKVTNILRKEECSAGSTAIVAIYDGRRHVLTVANVGDSMCVLSRSGRAVKLHRVHRLSGAPEHEEERKRVEATGSYIVNHRVDGVLAVSRAFGDVALKGGPKNPGPVIAVPDIHSEVITPMTEFGIIASDGLWDVMEPQLSVNFVRKLLNKKNDLQEAAAELVREAIAKGSVDNVTVLLLSFHMPPKAGAVADPDETKS